MAKYKHKFKFNPLDISSIFLLDEEVNRYIEIPNANPEFGPISLEEYLYLRRILNARGFKTDIANIMLARESLSDLIGQSKAEKKTLLLRQKKARSRSNDLGMHPKVSQEQKDAPNDDKIVKRVFEDFEVEVPD